MSELKPCPFCNTLPDAESMGEDGYYITCSNLECESADGISPEAWNTRPIEGALTAERDALRAELEQAKQQINENPKPSRSASQCIDRLRLELEQAREERDNVLRRYEELRAPVYPYLETHSHIDIKKWIENTATDLAGAREALRKIQELATYDIDHEEDGNTYQIEAIARAALAGKE